MHDVHAWLTALDIFRQHENQEFIKDHLTNIEKGTHLSNLWARLGIYWNFLNFDLLEHLVSGFGSEDLKRKMNSYKCDLQSFRKATRICDFINCWPERVEPPPERELREFVAKVGYHWENCTLEDLDMLEGVITRKFFLPRFVLQLREIKPGCITVTWLVAVPFVKALKETIQSSSSEFFMEHKIETIIIDGEECYPTPTGNPVEYSEQQFTSESLAKSNPLQSENPSVSIVPEKLHSFKSEATEKQAFPKETHRMRLAKEILSGEATSMAPEVIQFGTHGKTKQETPPSSFLSKRKRKRKLGIRQQTIPSKQPIKHQRIPYTSASPDKMEGLSEEFPKPHFHVGGTKPRSRDPGEALFDSPKLDAMKELSLMLGGSKPKSGHSSSTSGDWFEVAEKDVRRGGWVNPSSPAERYVREKCVDKISQQIKLLPAVEQYRSIAEVEADPSLLTKYKDYLYTTPSIRAALYTTFNAKMAAEVFTWSQHTDSPPPTTMTELFTAFTLKTLADHLSIHPVYHKQQLKVTTFSDLPTDVYKQFQDLCRMAYEGILNRQQLVFSVSHLPTGFASLGLMQEVPQLYTEGKGSSYHFIHLTLQEYLAAVHISQLPAHEQTKLFREHVYIGHFKMTMRFLAGLTKLANIPPDITMGTKLNHFHFLFEAKDISMTSRTLGSDEMYVNSDYSWTPLDYYVSGHAISHSNCSWRLYFMSSSNDDEKFELFCQGCGAPGGTGCRGHILHADFSSNGITSKSIHSFVNIPSHILQNMRELDLNHNKLDGSACDLLSKAVPSMTRLERLSLGSNPLGNGGAVEVIKALCGSGVKQLWLYNTRIGEPDCEALCELLRSSHSLQHLHIHQNNLSSESVASIITGLKVVENKTLTWLDLQDCHISSEGAVELAAALCKNSTLKRLNLSHNPIGVEGASSMSDMLQHNTSLEYFSLCDDSVGEEGVHQLINSLKHNQTLNELWLPRKYKSETSDNRIHWR